MKPSDHDLINFIYGAQQTLWSEVENQAGKQKYVCVYLNGPP